MMKFVEQFSFIGDVRGEGFFLGLDFVKDKKSKEEDGETARLVSLGMRQKGCLINRDGPKNNVLKFKPPIVFRREQADEFLEKLTAVLEDVEKEKERDDSWLL